MTNDTTLNLRYYMNGSDAFNFSDHQNLTDDQIEFIATNLPSDCRKVIFRRTELTTIGISFIAINLLLRGGNLSNNLICLCLSDASVTDEGVKSICDALSANKNNKLQNLILDQNGKITCIGAQSISDMLENMKHGCLKVLDLSYTMIGSLGVYALCKALLQNKETTLRQLDITGSLSVNEKSNDEDLKNIIETTNNSGVEVLHYS